MYYLYSNNNTDFVKGQEFNANEKVVIRYHVIAKCSVNLHVDFIPNLIFNKYDVKLSVNGISKGILEYGEDADFAMSIEPGELVFKFENEDSSSVNGSMTVNIEGDADISLKINCYEDKITVTTVYVEDNGAVGDNEAMVPFSAADLKYTDYTDVQKSLEEAGFTNISFEILYDIVLGWTNEGEVESISINKETDFKHGDIFDTDAEVIITYHMKEVDDPNKKVETETSKESESETTKSENKSTQSGGSSVSYSTNTSDTVKNGNSGVYSYMSRGGSYDIYWIIDFDEGYVYWFTEGNGDTTCDRLKIDSGDLNSVVIITYHDGEDTWSYGLHFKYVDNPDHLIMQDNDGFEYDYYTTNLSSALSLRSHKTIKDY